MKCMSIIGSTYGFQMGVLALGALVAGRRGMNKPKACDQRQ